MATNVYTYAAEKLTELAGENLWPLAMLYFDPITRGLKCAILPQGAELIRGHGRKIGVIMESQARQLCQLQKSTSGGAKTVPEAPGPPSQEQPKAPPAAETVER